MYKNNQINNKIEGGIDTMYKCEELNKLERYLQKHGIQYIDKTIEGTTYKEIKIERIHITDKKYTKYARGNIISVINSEFTYGGDKGLLEYWNGIDEIEGYMLASQVIKKLKKEYKKYNKKTNLFKTILLLFKMHNVCYPCQYYKGLFKGCTASDEKVLKCDIANNYLK